MNENISGKVVVITGASSGLGEVTAALEIWAPDSLMRQTVDLSCSPGAWHGAHLQDTLPRKRVQA